MYDFIVGGYLPGTNIQISYQAWIAITTVVFGILAIGWIEYNERVLKILRSNHARKALQASALHYRIQFPAK